MERAYDQELLEFLRNSPSVYHVVAGQKQRLLEAGYRQLLEGEAWDLRPGGRYFLTRNGSAILAFRVPEGEFRGFMIMASHSDFPALKIKEHPEIPVEGAYQKLNVELYGGALLAPWFDRPLSVAGRFFLAKEPLFHRCHTAVDKQQAGVVFGHQREAAKAQMAFAFKIVQVFFA